ncbi:MAG TPA: class I SAM-dependent methyltransferase, partial [Allocoleopsis sp.]
MTTTKLKPDWAGEDLLSKIVNLLINNKFIYPIMKNQARQVLIKTAEKNGISWRKFVESLDIPQVKQILEEVTNPNIVYPAYYQVPFHAYNEGNLSWQAAFEAIPATKAMALRVWKNEPLTWEVAQTRLRQSFLEILGKYTPKNVENV